MSSEIVSRKQPDESYKFTMFKSAAKVYEKATATNERYFGTKLTNIRNNLQDS